ncbi:multiheme c-type cytochrome [Thermodesulfobacteriota bacterium]
MADGINYNDCHGELHKSESDVEKAQLPTISTCESCHSEQAAQYLSGKHALGLVALEAMPYNHMQPKSFVEGQKGCGGCHTLGLKGEKERQSKGRKYYRYGMDCHNCHTRHAFSKAEASEPSTFFPVPVSLSQRFHMEEHSPRSTFPCPNHFKRHTS